jgi:hypothetical protein
MAFQFNVVATDQGNPQQTAVQSASVTVTVVRNTVGPVFNQSDYTTSVNEDASLGTLLYDLDAVDNSNVRSSHLNMEIKRLHIICLEILLYE